MKLVIILLLINLVLSSFIYGQSNENPINSNFINPAAANKFPVRSDFVNDFEHLFSKEQCLLLDSIINEYYIRTSNYIVIVTVESVVPYNSLKDFSSDLSRYWHIEKTKKDNGFIMAFSNNLKSIWFGTGLKNENKMNNDLLPNIIDNEILPLYNKGEYFEGIKSGVIEYLKSYK